MGMLDDLVGQVAGNILKGGDSGNQLIAQILGLIQSHGGVGGLVQKFEASVLGSLAASWVRSGSNLPVSADQITHALGSDAVSGVGSSLGLSHQDTATALAHMLPQVIDRLTPKGTVESTGGDLSGQLASLAGAIFGQHQ